MNQRLERGLTQENAALRTLLAEPEFAGTSLEYPPLTDEAPDFIFVQPGRTTYVEFKSGPADVRAAVAKLDAWLAVNAPEAAGLLVLVGRQCLKTIPSDVGRPA